MPRHTRSIFQTVLSGAAVASVLAGCASGPAAEPAPAARPAGGTDETVSLVIAATTDVHGRVRGWDYFAGEADTLRGLARAATIVDSLRAANAGRVVLLDAGDLLQGNPFTYVAARVDSTAPHPVVAAMNAMHYDAGAIGNHEFNYGIALLDRAVAQATFPFLSANTVRPNGERAYRGWVITERQGVKVGIVGATTPGVMVWDRDNVRGRLEVRDIVPAVRQAVGEVRQAGADVVVVTVHSGLGEPSSYDTATTGVPSENVTARLAREIPGIDLIVFGHSHREVADSTIGSTLLLQPKNWATSVGVATLAVARDGGRWRVVGRRGALVRAAGHAESRTVLEASETAHQRTVAYVAMPVGGTPVAWRADSARVVDTPLIDFMLEVMRRTAKADLAATAAFSLDASLDSGEVTVAEMARLYPFENTLRAVRISGRQLREFLEYSARYYRTYVPGATDTGSLVDPDVPGYNFDIVAGAAYTLDLARPLGSRVTRLEVKGRPVQPTDSFTLALNNYRQTGGGGYAMLSGAPVVYDRQEEIRQLLIDEVKRRGTVRPEDYFTPNWRLEPAAAVALAYADASAGNSPPPAAYTSPTSGATPGEGRPDSRPASGTRRLRIIATNDFHGALEARPDAQGVRRGGAVALATAIRHATTECAPDCETLLLDGGDMFQGTPASNLAFGRPVVELYDTLGYAAAALGNHEFDWGVDTLQARMRQARYGVLAANVRHADGRDVEWVPDDTLVRRGTLTIGIIGVATVATPQTTRAANTRGLRFDDPAPVVDARARQLRARGADVVVVVAHAGAHCGRDGATDCGGEIIDLAQRVTEPLDAIVSGHTHSLVDVTVRGIPIVQARSTGRAVAVLDLAVDPASVARPVADAASGGVADGRTSRVLGADVRDVLADSAAPLPVVEGIVRRAVTAVAPLVNRPVGRIAVTMPRGGPQYALGNLVADAQRAAGKGDIAVMNTGGIRADLPAGPATYGTLFEVQPFANVLYRATVRGSDLRVYLERLLSRSTPNAHVSGVQVTYDPSRPAGTRIVRALVGGRALADSATYTVVLNDFMVTGGDGLGLGQQALKLEPLNIVDLDALIAYVRARPGGVSAPPVDRLVPTHP